MSMRFLVALGAAGPVTRRLARTPELGWFTKVLFHLLVSLGAKIRTFTGFIMPWTSGSWKNVQVGWDLPECKDLILRATWNSESFKVREGRVGMARRTELAILLQLSVNIAC